MKCPTCGLLNPGAAQRCDCGYDFRSGKQDEPRLGSTAVAATKNASDDKLPPFSVGAGGITILWLFFHGRSGTALQLIGLNIAMRLLVLIPRFGFFLVLIIGVGVILHFGSEGSKIAMEHKHYKSIEELRAGERGWTIAGTIGLCLYSVYAVIGFAAMLGFH